MYPRRSNFFHTPDIDDSNTVFGDNELDRTYYGDNWITAMYYGTGQPQPARQATMGLYPEIMAALERADKTLAEVEELMLKRKPYVYLDFNEDGNANS